MKLPNPLTTFEAIYQLRHTYWHMLAVLFESWDFPYNKSIETWALAFQERELLVGTQQAWKDYNG